ncbi:hypothetical protein QAD02_020902 [Eretmocerus hayati]|uniref:Uncharacterized protein n=1 Tax=Eretmocerus hayati TaxID=131215 RepID=A0ACC2PP82_9HYME|nr:hypothetical protein QAD02_020902 [Eretmocerus hayati]
MDDNENLKTKLLDQFSKIERKDGERTEALNDNKPSAPSLGEVSDGVELRPKDVISWISEFDGSNNVKVFVREVQDALQHMTDWLDKKCVLRMVLASKIKGPVKELISSQEADSWEDIQDLLLHYYSVQDVPYTYLEERRNKIILKSNGNVMTYSRAYMNAHRKVLRAAG